MTCLRHGWSLEQDAKARANFGRSHATPIRRALYKLYKIVRHEQTQRTVVDNGRVMARRRAPAANLLERHPRRRKNTIPRSSNTKKYQTHASTPSTKLLAGSSPLQTRRDRRGRETVAHKEPCAQRNGRRPPTPSASPRGPQQAPAWHQLHKVGKTGCMGPSAAHINATCTRVRRKPVCRHRAQATPAAWQKGQPQAPGAATPSPQAASCTTVVAAAHTSATAPALPPLSPPIPLPYRPPP